MNKLVLICILFFANSCKQEDSKPYITGKEGQNLPEFEVLMPDSATYFKTSTIIENVPVVMFYFSPTCPYCRIEMRRIINSVKDFPPRTQFIAVTGKGFKEMKAFAKEFKNNGHRNIRIAYDDKYMVDRYYKVPAVPFLAIYGKDKKLKGSFTGAISVKQMKKVIES